MGFLDILGFRSSKSDRFYALFAAQGDVVHRATDVLSTLGPGGPTASEVARLVQNIVNSSSLLCRERPRPAFCARVAQASA